MADKITLQDSPEGDKQQVRGRLSKETNFRDGSKPPPQQRGWLQVCVWSMFENKNLLVSLPCASTRGEAALSASSAALSSIPVAPLSREIGQFLVSFNFPLYLWRVFSSSS
jgi:hypothetical protein